MLKKILIDAFNILKNNLIIIQPFILFLLVISFLAPPLGYNAKISAPMIVLMVSVFALISAFLAGWFQLFQAAIRNYRKDLQQEDKQIMSFGILREFFPAVGAFFVPVLVAAVLYCVMMYLAFKLAVMLGQQYIGVPESFRVDNLLQIFADEKKAYEFISSLSDADKLKISQWNLLTLFITGMYSYLTMFWFPAIIMNAQNAFQAFWTGLKALFDKPFVSFGIFAFYWILNFFASLLSSFAPGNFIVQLLNLMFIIYIMNCYIMSVFVYFEDYSENSIDRWTNSFR